MELGLISISLYVQAEEAREEAARATRLAALKEEVRKKHAPRAERQAQHERVL